MGRLRNAPAHTPAELSYRRSTRRRIRVPELFVYPIFVALSFSRPTAHGFSVASSSFGGGTVMSKFLASIPVRKQEPTGQRPDDVADEDSDDGDAMLHADNDEGAASQFESTSPYATTTTTATGGERSRRPASTSPGSANPSSNNPANDPVFLRKRTASLLALPNDVEDGPNLNGISNGKGFKPDKKTFHFLMDAWAFSSEPDAADMATALLRQMEALEEVEPDVRSYTKAMNAVARSNLPDGGERAASIFRQMAFTSSTRGSSVHPNAHSYTAVIEAYANGGAPNAAQQADAWCREMVRTFQKGDSSVVPTSRAFQAALSAHAKSGEPDSGQRAQQLMDLQEELWREHRIDECKPTRFNYHALIMAWVNAPDAGSAQNARRVLQKLEDSFRSGDADMKPTTVTYNAVIDAYAKAAEKRTLDDPASSPGESNDWSPESHAEELLRHMEGLHRTGVNEDARPNVRSFNSVLNVWAKSGRAEAADRAQEILTLMESMYQSGNEEVRPDVHSFCTVINAWARSPALNKADRAMNLFREMKQLYKSGNHEHLKPNVVAYNAVLNACAFCNSDPGGLHQSSHAMEMAHAILKEVESTSNPYGVKPDQVTYGTFLKVCANHLPDCSTRQQIVEMILRRCQRDGLVGSLVLQQLRSMVSDPDLYQNLVGKPQDQEISVEDLPPSWCRNFVEGKQRRRKQQQQQQQQRPWS